MTKPDDLVERLKAAHANSQQRALGSNILEEAAARIQELEAALRPFADIAPQIPGGMHDYTKVKMTAREPLGRSDSTLVLVVDGVSVGDFHAAAAAIRQRGQS